MNNIEQARLKPGKLIEWKGRHFTYHGYSHRAHQLKERNVSMMCEYMTGAIDAVPVYEYLSHAEILEAMVEGPTLQGE